MSFIDALFLVIFPVSVAFGFWRGFTREVISLISLVLALVLARSLGPAMTGVFDDWFGVRGVWVPVCSFVVIFLLVLIIGRITLFLVQSFVRGVGLQGWERLGGSLFGFLRALMILLAFALILDLTPFARSSWVRDAFSIQAATRINGAISLEWSREQISRSLEKIDEEIGTNIGRGEIGDLYQQVDDFAEGVGDVADELGDAGETIGDTLTEKSEETVEEIDAEAREKVRQLFED